MSNHSTVEKNIGKGSALKAEAFAKEHVHLLGTADSWDRDDIKRLAGLIFDQSQHFQEGYPLAVVAAFQRSILERHLSEELMPQLHILNAVLDHALTARAVMMDTPSKAASQLTQHEDPNWDKLADSQEESMQPDFVPHPKDNIIDFATYLALVEDEERDPQEPAV